MKAVNLVGETDKQTKFVSDNVVNLSNRVLSEAKISLLFKGLKFCPTPLELDRSAIKRDFKEFSRKKRFLTKGLCPETYKYVIISIKNFFVLIYFEEIYYVHNGAYYSCYIYVYIFIYICIYIYIYIYMCIYIYIYI